MPPKSKYTHLSQRNQILKRPAQHIGSTKNAVHKIWLVETQDSGDRIIEAEVNYNAGLMHIFYEVLSNAQDNYFNSIATNTPLRKIEIVVDKETGSTSIWNDGAWIPNKIHEWGNDEEIIDSHQHYEAEIIFGYLNSSSNYNDDETARIGGGLHGVGVKLTNIFSKEFNVECFDPDTGIKFKQQYTNSMSGVEPPKITKLKGAKGYTKITFTPDFGLFGVNGYTDTDIQIMRKMCFDCAMITGSKVIFNGDPIPVKSLLQYSQCYTDTQSVEFKTPECTVIVCEKPVFEPGLIQMSFVNGIATNRGGVHIEAWKKAILTPLLEKLKTKFSPKGKKSTPIKLTIKNLENYFMIFLNCTLPNPEFEGQTKGILTSPTPATNVPTSKITTMMKWGFVDDIAETVRVQSMKELSKTDGKKSATINISGADDANKAGTAKSDKCTLVIVEGLSAKAFVVKGISTIPEGPNWYGILPVRGKVLNVRGATTAQINDNKEITNIKEMLGLKMGLDYSKPENFNSLRYGKVILLTDADADGDHIKGLLINFFQFFYPSLLGRGFVSSIRTPIVKATIGKKTIAFYYLKNFKEWEKKQKTSYTVKYYKGLGTSTDAEIVELFHDPKHSNYIKDAETAESIDMVFSKTRANDRKNWLEKYVEKEFVYNNADGVEIVPISEFFNNEMIAFSIYDNKRSIPSVIDGFKPSQRKAMWVGLNKLNTKDDYKVSQFASEVARQAEYHHGETSMQQAIIGMAQSFVGSNNIPLFYESGQFGTRSAGGQDASAGRYIFTRLHTITRCIFRKEDDPILEYNEEDGSKIEPVYFAPIIPMLLVNGCTGIGTGYSTNIPSFNPLHLVEWIRVWIQGGVDFPDLVPWYRGFKGTTVPDSDNKQRYIHYGQIQNSGKDCYDITELPIRVWTDDYKDFLNTLKTGKSAKETKTGYDSWTVAQLKGELGERKLTASGTKKVLIDRLKQFDKENGTSAKKMTGGNSGGVISKWENYSDAYTVNLRIWTKSDIQVDCTNPVFKLSTTDSLTNMTAFTPSGGLKKYDDLTEILNAFCNVRYSFYEKRKKYLVICLEKDLVILQTRAKFINAVLENFDLLHQPETDLFHYLRENNYYEMPNGYRYLTDMPIRTFTTDNHKKLLDEIAELTSKIIYIKKRTEKEMWLDELAEFCNEYSKWTTEMDATKVLVAKKNVKR